MNYLKNMLIKILFIIKKYIEVLARGIYKEMPGRKTHYNL